MKLGLSRIIVVLLTMAAPAVAERLELPSAGLESRVDFWKKVYTQYGADDVIVHDRIHVNLIYDIATDSDVALRTAAVRQALTEIAANLETPEALGPVALQIRDTILSNGVSLSAATLAELRDNIHTQRGIKERFRDGIVRSGRYIEAFTDVFEKEGLPTEIALLPLVESSFENRSLSKAGAAGIWQFTRSTGRLYMKINRNLDERLDPPKATRAAVRLLKDNYKALGSWPLAITAYNHGRGGMLRAQSEVGPEITKIISEYRGRLFGYASMNFYAEFLAAVDVYQNYEQHFGQLVLDKPTTKAVAKPVQVAAAAKAKAAAPKPSPADKYKVRKGDTLFEIAQKFGLSVRELMDLNNLRKSAIQAGQILLVK
jgi:membrane-bound lytic murein transglycosylase D